MSVPLRYSIAGKTASAIARSLEALLEEGRLAPGEALPTVRALARALRVSPATVASAYRRLGGRGLLQGRGRRGTRVAPRPPLALARRPAAVASHLRNLAEGNPDPVLIPRLRRVLAALPDRPRLYGEPTYEPELLAAASRQLVADGIPARDLAVVGGALDGIERVLQVHLRAGDKVAVEDPGYSALFDLLGALGLVAEPVAVDEAGVLPGELARALEAGALGCILTPRAQNPTGAAFDPARARKLRPVLDAHSGVLVIEDDHAGPVAGVPCLTLSPRGRERWAVVRSVSKSLGPDLRLAVLAGDAATIARVEGRQALGSGWVSHILQATVAALWADPAVERQLRKAADTYSRRRREFLAALGRRGIAAQGRSGLNVWIPVPEEGAVIAALAGAGWAVRGGEPYRLRSAPAIRVTIASLREDEVERLADDVARAARPAERRQTA
jgi:DNA-binding transcriptional MocR family regulator